MADTRYNEQLIFWHILSDTQKTAKYKEHYFQTDGLRKLFGILRPYVLKYNDVPNVDVINTLIQQDGRYTAELTPDVIHALYARRDEMSRYSREWIDDEARGNAEWNAFVHGIEAMQTHILLSQGDLTPADAHDFVAKARDIFDRESKFDVDDDGFHDFFDISEHKESKVERTSTGYPFIDECLNGGLAKKTLNVWMGSPKVGKSMWLCNLCANSVRNGDNSAYITLEMSYALVNQRIGSNLFSIPMSEYESRVDDAEYMTAKMNAFRASCGTPGALLIREFPTSSATVRDVEAALLAEERNRSTAEKPFKFRNIYIDYINLMTDRKAGKSDNMYVKIKNIAEDVRAMAQKNDWCVVSLTQTNRSAYNSKEISMSSVSESAGLTATVDSLFSIIQTTEMNAANVYYIDATALRNSTHMGDRKKYEFDGEHLRITESDEPMVPCGMEIPDESGESRKIPPKPAPMKTQLKKITITPAVFTIQEESPSALFNL